MIPVWCSGAVLRAAVLVLRASNGRVDRFLDKDDSAEYLTLSKDFSAYWSKTNPNVQLGLNRTPVYPAFLGAVHFLTGSRIIGPMVIQVLLGIVVVYMTYALARDLIGRGAAASASAFVALDPVSIMYSSKVLTETLFTLLLLGSVYVLWRRNVQAHWSRGLAAGVLIGLATLTRPEALYLPLVVAVGYLVLERRALRSAVRVAVAYMAAVAIIAGGWTAHNYTLGHVDTVSTIGAFNLLYYRAGGALAEENHISLSQASSILRRVLKAELPPHPSAGTVDGAEESLAIRTIRQHKVGFLKETIKGAGALMFGPGSAEIEEATGGHGYRILKGYADLYLVVAYVCVVVGTGVLWRARMIPDVWLPLLVVVYTVAIASGAESYSRFRVSIMPYLALFAGVGALAVVRLLRRWPCLSSRRGSVDRRGLHRVRQY